MTLPTIILTRTKITYQVNPDGTVTFVKSIPEACTNAQNNKEYKLMHVVMFLFLMFVLLILSAH